MRFKKQYPVCHYLLYIYTFFLRQNKNSFVIDNISSIAGPVMKHKIPRGLFEQLSVVGWLYSRICRPPGLHVYDICPCKHQIYLDRLRFYFRLRHLVSAQSIFVSVGELDKKSIIKFMGTKEEKLISKSF